MTELALSLLIVIAYTYAGYPLLVAAWSRILPRRATSHSDYEPTVSVCIAVSNGAAYLEKKLESVLALDYPPDKLEILVCSDGSTDETSRITRRFAERDSRVHLIDCPTRRGKPSALNLLREAARGEVLLMTDVRQRLGPGALRALVSPLADPTIGCVSGSLVLSGSSGASAYWRYERFIRDSEGRLGAMVGVSGSIYAVRRVDLPPLPEDVILDDMFVPLRIALGQRRIVFAEAAEAFDEAVDDEREFGRKVRTLTGNYQLLAKMPELLLPIANPVWFQMVSHKLLRLVCPWALVGLLTTSLFIALVPGAELSASEVAFWRTVAFGQVLFYVLAALGPRGGRVAGLARTFVVLNAAAVAGLWRFVRGTQPITW